MAKSKIKANYALLAAALLTMMQACTSSVPINGREVPCIGAFEEPDPRYVYKANVKNIVLAIIFVEMVIPTVVIILDETRCPVSERFDRPRPEYEKEPTPCTSRPPMKKP